MKHSVSAAEVSPEVAAIVFDLQQVIFVPISNIDAIFTAYDYHVSILLPMTWRINKELVSSGTKGLQREATERLLPVCEKFWRRRTKKA